MAILKEACRKQTTPMRELLTLHTCIELFKQKMDECFSPTTTDYVKIEKVTFHHDFVEIQVPSGK